MHHQDSIIEFGNLNRQISQLSSYKQIYIMYIMATKRDNLSPHLSYSRHHLIKFNTIEHRNQK